MWHNGYTLDIPFNANPNLGIIMTRKALPIEALDTAIESAAVRTIDALVSVDKAASKANAAIAMAFQQVCDVALATGITKSQGGIDALGSSVRNCQTFTDAVASGLIEKKTVVEYAQGVMRAVFHGVPWGPRLKNDPAYKLPWGKVSAPKPKQATKTASNALDAKPSIIGAPADEQAARDFIAGQLRTLVAYGNKHMKTLDLKTRDLLPQLDKIAQTISKIGAAPR
jgi:hypothetical protein